jgi:hypothetical protein
VSHNNGKRPSTAGRELMTERDKIIEMLAKVDDHFALSVYKKVYHVTDKEVVEKKKTMKAHEKAKKA